MLHIPRHKFEAATALARIFERTKAKGANLSARDFTCDEMFTLDSQLQAQFGGGITADSTGVFLISQLERLDRVLNEPLYDYTWSRDVILRTDVSLGDELASWTNTNYASPGGVTPSGINWISGNSNAIPGPAIDIGKTAQPLHGWGQELSWSVFDLAKSALLGMPIETSKYDAMDMKWNMDVDQVVYTGESAFTQFGLLNNTAVTPVTFPATGTGSSTLWTTKTPQQVLIDVNDPLNAVYASSGYKVMPSKILIPPAQFLYINQTIVSTAGNQSLLKFLRENNASIAITGKPLEIYPCKWCIGRGAGGLDRMMVYEQQAKYMRYPMVPRQRTPLELRSIFQLTTYYAKLGFIEFRYPETVAYRDGL